MAIISIFLATLLASASYAAEVSGTSQGTPNTGSQGSGVAQQQQIGNINGIPQQQQIGIGPDIGPSNPQQIGIGLGGQQSPQQQQNQRLIQQQLIAQQIQAQQQQQQNQIPAQNINNQQSNIIGLGPNTNPNVNQAQSGQNIVIGNGQTSNVVNTQQQISNNVNNNVIGLGNTPVTPVNPTPVTQPPPQTPNPGNSQNRIGLGQSPNNVGLGYVPPVNNVNNGQFGGVYGNNNGLGLGNNGYINSAAQILVGTYQWIGQDASIYTLFVCSGLPGDRFVYAAVQRTNVNAYGLPDNSYTFAYIVARGIVRLGADGASASLRGFRLADAFGVDSNFQLLLTFSRCDNLYQLQINDETYTLVKIGVQNPQQQQCMRPSYVHNFNNLGGRQQQGTNNAGFATFQSYSPLHWRMPNRFGLGNHGFNNLLTLRGGYFNNQYGIFGCGGFQNPLTNSFFPGYRRHFGNFGPYGNLYWNNALLVNAFDDDMFDDDFGWDCDRGIEFDMFLDNGDLWENQQCYNQPTVGWAGRLSPIAPLPNWGINQCPLPNLAGLRPNLYPGWSPLRLPGFFGW